MYADYTYYSTIYYNGIQKARIPEIDAGMYLKRASVFLNSLLFNQKPTKPYNQALKDACCEIADCFYRFDLSDGISYETNDGYSVRFDKSTSCEKRAYDIAVRYLGRDGLLYRGLEK